MMMMVMVMMMMMMNLTNVGYISHAIVICITNEKMWTSTFFMHETNLTLCYRLSKMPKSWAINQRASLVCLPTCLSVCLSVVSLSTSLCLTVSLSVSLSARLYVCLFVCPCLSVYLCWYSCCIWQNAIAQRIWERDIQQLSDEMTKNGSRQRAIHKQTWRHCARQSDRDRYTHKNRYMHKPTARLSTMQPYSHIQPTICTRPYNQTYTQTALDSWAFRQPLFWRRRFCQ